MPRNAHQDALDAPTFERLLAATDELAHPFDAECFGILVFGGRLGMRAGEIAHLDESWVDWTRRMIEIPRHHPCDCGYCRARARAHAKAADTSLEKALAGRWNPKTPASARAIPFDFDDTVEAAIEAFFDVFDAYEHSRASVNRRVDRVAEAADLETGRLYPHALRATAATHHAYRGVAAPALQSMMGWSKLATAEKYIRLSGGATAEALRDAHS